MPRLADAASCGGAWAVRALTRRALRRGEPKEEEQRKHRQ
eukprot:gene13651-17685_t